jgi:hypothetical protein
MRERNVRALAELLEKAAAADQGGYRLTSRSVVGNPGGRLMESPARLAEWLVQAGAVLVPEAVSEQEAIDLLHKEPAELFARVSPEAEGSWFREGLRRMAGDAPAASLEDATDEVVLCLKGTHQWDTAASHAMRRTPALVT